MIAFGVAACTTPQVASRRPAIASYFDAARSELQRCVDVTAAEARTSSPSPMGDDAQMKCATEAAARVDTYYRAARQAVKWEKGTTMYLGRHHDEWRVSMTEATHCRRNSDAHSCVAKAIERLVQLEEQVH